MLGKKWTLLIIRDIAFLKLGRFGQILKNNPELTPRVLSRRLEQMTDEGLVRKVKGDKSRALTSGYFLTEKGEDAVYILLAMLRYGIKHHMNPKIEKRDEEQIIMDLESVASQRWSY